MKRQRHSSSRQSSSRRRRLLGILALAGVVVAVVVVSGTAFALNQENHDAFCASCHTEPEATFYQRTLDSSSAPTLAVFHADKGVRCIDCHSAGGPFGRTAGLEQGAQDLIAYYSGNYHKPAITTHKLGDSSCTKCHGNVTADRSFNNHFHLFLARWQSVDRNAAHCVDCHTSHPTADPSQGYLVQSTVVAVCQHCHQVLAEG